MTFRATSALISAFALTACLGSVPGPSISVEKAVGTCFAPCDAGVALSVPLADHCDSSVVPDCVNWAGGRDTFRVVADYGSDLEFTAPSAVPLPSLTEMTTSGASLSVANAFEPHTDSKHFLATAKVLAPVDATTVSFTVSSDGGTNFVATTSSFRVSDATISASIAQCPNGKNPADGGVCILPAGEGVATITVVAPPGLAADGGTVTFSVDDIPAATVASVVFDTMLDPQNISGTTAPPITAPDSPGSTWKLTARVGRFKADLPAVTLTRAAQIDLAIAAGDAGKTAFPPGPQVQRAAAESDARCRVLTLGIRAPDHASDKKISLSTSVFSVTTDGNATDTVTADASGLAFATLLLPVAPVADRVATVRATSGPEAAGSGKLVLSEVAPSSAALVSPVNVNPVTASGSAAVTLSGRLVPPRTGLPFPPGTAVTVITRASNTASASLPCGAPVQDDTVFCDPGHVDPGTVAPGGCLFGAPQATIAGDGSFSVPLASGVCFTGTLSVEIWSRQTTEINPAKCVGELVVSDPKLLVSKSLQFAVPPPP